jgi:hypothetical protein
MTGTECFGGPLDGAHVTINPGAGRFFCRPTDVLTAATSIGHLPVYRYVDREHALVPRHLYRWTVDHARWDYEGRFGP